VGIDRKKSKSNQTKPNQTKPNQTKPNQTKPNHGDTAKTFESGLLVRQRWCDYK
jgi:hypothetical protein